MAPPGRKPRQITVRAIGAPSDAGLRAFAKLIMEIKESEQRAMSEQKKDEPAKLTG